ncbi:GntR family transcriptional regulator [Desulfitispora alkaliphila]|uniref:GntR family transcriptional regulator n=1 Tax=Desulfitispora alkaliphila TaxID=622674 RepID=UPI003D1AE847
MFIDKHSDIPLHVQLKNILKEEIKKKRVEEKIPSERELMEEFSVSRSTVRQTIEALVDEGILEKIRGRGTFIRLRPMEEWLGNLRSYNETIIDMEMNPRIKILEQGVKRAPGRVAELYGEEEVYYLKRLRFANDYPIMVEEQYYPKEIGVELAKYDLNDAAIYDLLETELGLTLWEAEQAITSSMPSEEECGLLQITKEQCTLVTERLIFEASNKLVEYEKSIIRADMYAFKINLARRNV